MNTQKIKSILLFIVLAVIFFYAAHRFARHTEVDLTAAGGQSVSFLEVVNNLSTIQFDFEFIESLGTAKLLTREYVQAGVLHHLIPVGIIPLGNIIRHQSRSPNFGRADFNFGSNTEVTVVDVPVRRY